MALQPTNKPVKTGSSKTNKPNLRVILIITAVFIIMIVLMIIANNSSTQELPDYVDSNIQPTVTTEQSSVQDEYIVSIPQTDITDTGANIFDLAYTDSSIFHQKDNVFSFDESLQYSGAQPLAEDNKLYLGADLWYVPTKTCTFHYDKNKLDISHTSGSLLSIVRSSLDNDIEDFSIFDAELTNKLEKGKATEISLATVYRGSYACGRRASGVVSVDENDYFVSIAYVTYDDILYTIIGVAQQSFEEFLDLMQHSLYIDGITLTVG